MTASDFKKDCIYLPQNLTVRAITAVQRDMLQSIDKNQSVSMELPEDCQVDISFIQLVEAARIYAGKAGKHIALARPAKGPTLDVLQRSGFPEGFTAADQKFWLHEGGIQ